MRFVLDTNILVRANAKAKGPARELLQLIVESHDHVLLLSPFLLEELERVFFLRACASLVEAHG
jgi:predicted nucleic acid-binding protein